MPLTATPIAEALARDGALRVPSVGLLRFLLRRFAALVLLSLGITLVVFLLTEIVPSNAAATALGEQAAGDPAAVAAFNHHYGLDKPLPDPLPDLPRSIWCTATSGSRR